MCKIKQPQFVSYNQPPSNYVVFGVLSNPSTHNFLNVQFVDIVFGPMGSGHGYTFWMSRLCLCSKNQQDAYSKN
jgi:hypothetical protein